MEASVQKPGSSRRNLLLALFVVAAVIVGVVFLLTRPAPYTPEVTGRPSGVVSQDYFDYGDVKGGTWIETSFKIKNVGDQPLNVITEPYVELIEGCCPPIAEITARTLNPGDEATVSMSFMMDGDMVGQHEFLAHIMTDDPVQPDKQVRILSNWLNETDT
jgi:hypothetical protein